MLMEFNYFVLLFGMTQRLVWSGVLCCAAPSCPDVVCATRTSRECFGLGGRDFVCVLFGVV